MTKWRQNVIYMPALLMNNHFLLMSSCWPGPLCIVPRLLVDLTFDATKKLIQTLPELELGTTSATVFFIVVCLSLLKGKTFSVCWWNFSLLEKNISLSGGEKFPCACMKGKCSPYYICNKVIISVSIHAPISCSFCLPVIVSLTRGFKTSKRHGIILEHFLAHLYN